MRLEVSLSRARVTLPMDSPQQAADELRRAVTELGFVGFIVNGHSQGRCKTREPGRVGLDRSGQIEVSQSERELIAHGNAERLLRLPGAPSRPQRGLSVSLLENRNDAILVPPSDDGNAGLGDTVFTCILATLRGSC